MWAMERSAEPCHHRAHIRTSSRPFVLPRPDEELDSRFFNVDPHFNCGIQSEGRKNVVVDCVVFAGNGIHGVHLHGFTLSTETRLTIGHISYLVRLEPSTSAQSDVTVEACIRKLHVPANSQISLPAFRTKRQHSLRHFQAFSATVNDG